MVAAMSATGSSALEPREKRGSSRGRFHWPGFAADAFLVSGGALAANVLNYVYHFVLSRKLGPDGYGSLATLLAITTIVGVVGSSIGTLAMQETARLWATHRDDTIVAFGRRMLRSAAGIGAIAGVASLALALPLAAYLHIEDRLAWLSLSASLFAGIVSSYARGAILGAHRFGRYAASLVAESTVKLLAGVVLVSAGFAVGGAIAGVALGIFAGLVIALMSLLSGHAEGGAEYRVAQFGGSAARLSLIYAASMALLFVDTVFAKHALSGNDAGYYSAAGLVARIIPFGVGLIVPLVTPKAVAARFAGRAALVRLLAVTFGVAIAGTAVALAAMEIWPSAIVAVTFGAKFAHAADLLRLYAVDASLIALGVLGSAYLAAMGEYRVGLWLIVALALETGAMAVWGVTPFRLLAIAIAGNALVLPAIAALVARSLRETPQAPGPPPAEASNTEIP
jgi:O-antigen/teichoic acid export membrane protein